MEKYNIAFCGDLTQNNGPANVNKELLKYFDCKKIDTKSKNRFKMVLNFICSLFTCKVFIFSSIYRVNYLLFTITTLCNKKTIYLMHGCSQFDAKINKVKNAEKINLIEKKLIDKIDVILVVSKKYMEIVKNVFPQYSDKFHYLTNGIDITKYSNIEKKNNKDLIVATCGGNRFIKCNKNVSKAIKKINENNKKEKVYLNLYGLFYDRNEEIEEDNYIKKIGRIPQSELYNELGKSKLFVLNSKYESFGLSVVDALMCGCNILISKNAGITDILDLKENDIINNFDDIDEISKKIKYNLENDNNKRILDSINFQHYSWENVSKRLEKIIISYMNREDYKQIK